MCLRQSVGASEARVEDSTSRGGCSGWRLWIRIGTSRVKRLPLVQRRLAAKFGSVKYFAQNAAGGLFSRLTQVTI